MTYTQNNLRRTSRAHMMNTLQVEFGLDYWERQKLRNTVDLRNKILEMQAKKLEKEAAK